MAKHDVCAATLSVCPPRTCTLLLNVTVLRGVIKPLCREQSSAHSSSVVLRPRGTITPPHLTMSAFDAPPQPPPPQFVKKFPQSSPIRLRRLNGPGGPLTSVLVHSVTAAATASAVIASSRPWRSWYALVWRSRFLFLILFMLLLCMSVVCVVVVIYPGNVGDGGGRGGLHDR